VKVGHDFEQLLLWLVGYKSMNHRTGLDRSQTLLFPTAGRTTSPPKTPLALPDAFVGSLDLHALGFAKAQCAPRAVRV